MAGRLTEFTIADDGALTDRRVFAQLDGAIPDGICLDAEGAIWLACPLSGRVLRVAEGGRVLQTIDAGRGAFACALGDADGRSLYVLTASTSDPDECVARRDGRLERIRVDVPGRPT
jgi:sugar lactone lactonase YvrE